MAFAPHTPHPALISKTNWEEARPVRLEEISHKAGEKGFQEGIEENAAVTVAAASSRALPRLARAGLLVDWSESASILNKSFGRMMPQKPSQHLDERVENAGYNKWERLFYKYLITSMFSLQFPAAPAVSDC